MLAVCCLLLSALCLRAELAFKWTVEVSQPLPYAAEALQGETFNLEAKMVQYRVPMLEAAEATFYYQTPEMEASSWYTTPAAWDATTATASVAFTPAMDVGSTKYRFFFGIETAQGKNYRVFGTLRLKASPGFSPATLTPTDVRAEIVAELRAELKPLIDAEAETRATQDGILIAAIASEREAREEADADLSEQLTAHSEQMANLCTIEALEAEMAAREAADNTFFKTDGTRNLGSGNYGWALAGVHNGDTVGGWGVRHSSSNLNGYTALRYDFLSVTRNGTEDRYWFTNAGSTKQIARLKDIDAAVAAIPQVTVDSTLSSTSTNPVQNKAVYRALNDVRISLDYRLETGDSPYSSEFDALFGGDDAFRGQPATLTVSSSNQGGVLGFTEINGTGYIAWKSDKDGQRRKYALGGGNTEVWKGNVGFGDQDTFIGAKRTADGDGQFLNGYPRLHNHGQDIHEVSGFSRDSRDDEDVWSHRLLLPWDLAKANDTSYLMAGVVWNGQRNLFTNGDTATFVQPLLPQNSGSTQSALPYAVPCFENSPVYWKGTIIWNDGTQAISKAVQIPWARVQQDMRGPDELALKRDIPSIDTALSSTSTNPVQNKAVKAALDGKADAQHTHAFEEMAVTVAGASYRWQWDETEGTFALVAEE